MRVCQAIPGRPPRRACDSISYLVVRCGGLYVVSHHTGRAAPSTAPPIDRSCRSRVRRRAVHMRADAAYLLDNKAASWTQHKCHSLCLDFLHRLGSSLRIHAFFPFCLSHANHACMRLTNYLYLYIYMQTSRSYISSL